MELTKQQFAEKINSLIEKGATFNVESVDTGSVYLFLCDCRISVTLENGVCGEATMYKPHTGIEITIDFDIVDEIKEDEDGTIYLELSNGLSDVVIKAIGLKKSRNS